MSSFLRLQATIPSLSTTNIFSSCKIASILYSFPPLKLFCQVLHSRSISPDSILARHSIISLSPEEIRQQVSSFPIRLYHVQLSAYYLRGIGIIHQLDTPSSKVLPPAQVSPDWYGRPYHVVVIWLGVSTLLSVRAHWRHYPLQCPPHRRCTCLCPSLDAFLCPARAVSIPPTRMNCNLQNIRIGRILRCVLPGLGPRVITRSMGSKSSCSNPSVMFLDSPDKILSPGRFESDSPDDILYLGCPSIVSLDKSSCMGSNVPDSLDIISSPDEQSAQGS